MVGRESGDEGKFLQFHPAISGAGQSVTVFTCCKAFARVVLKSSGVAVPSGGEAALWTEVASAGSLDSKLWPRAASYGARLWDYGVKHVDATTGWVEVELDLAAHASRLLARGIGSDQITPEFCQQQPHLCFPSSLPSV